MGSRIERQYGTPQGHRPTERRPQVPTPSPRQISVRPPQKNIPREVARKLTQAGCGYLASRYLDMGLRLFGAMAAELCGQGFDLFFPQAPGTIQGQPVQHPRGQLPPRGESQHVPSPRGQGSNPPGGQGSNPPEPQPIQPPRIPDAPPPEPGISPTTPPPSGQPPGGGGGSIPQGSNPPGVQGWDPFAGVPTYGNLPGLGQPPSSANPSALNAWHEGILVWDPITGGFVSNLYCSPFCQIIVPGHDLIIPGFISDPKRIGK